MDKFLEFIKKVFKLEDRVNKLIRIGIIKETDLQNNTVVVDLGNNLETPKLPYLVNCSGNAKVYFVPQVGDQVMVLSPNGDIFKSIILPSIYKGNVQCEENQWRIEFENGSIIYDNSTITIKSNSKVKIDSKKVILSGEDGGGVVCKNNLCSFTGSPHPDASTKVFGSK